MNHYSPKKREYVLTSSERIHEKLILGVCLAVCVAFFVKIVLF